jgi:hypothetical protein
VEEDSVKRRHKGWRTSVVLDGCCFVETVEKNRRKEQATEQRWKCVYKLCKREKGNSVVQLQTKD